MRLCLLPIVAILLTGCAGSMASPLQIEARPGEVQISFSNQSSESLTLDSDFALSNAGHGNLMFLLVDSSGVMHSACTRLDTLSLDYEQDKTLGAGQNSAPVSFALSFLQRAHCLTPGDYSVAAVYFDRRGHLYQSNTVVITVGQPATRPNSSFKPKPLRGSA